MPRTFLSLIAAALVASPLLADDNKDEKKAEKIDPAKLVGEWVNKNSDRPGLPIPLADVLEFGKEGEFKIKVAQPDDLPQAVTAGVGTYKMNGSAVEASVTDVEEETGKPRANAKARPRAMEVVKLTDTELHVKEDKEVNEYRRVTADDKDRTVDTAKLVGRWKSKLKGMDGGKEFVLIYEFGKGGVLIMSSAPATDLTKTDKKAETTYKLTNKKLEITLSDEDKKAGLTALAFDIIKLTDTGLTLRYAIPEAKGAVLAFERVKEEKKEK